MTCPAAITYHVSPYMSSGTGKALMTIVRGNNTPGAIPLCNQCQIKA